MLKQYSIVTKNTPDLSTLLLVLQTIIQKMGNIHHYLTCIFLFVNRLCASYLEVRCEPVYIKYIKCYCQPSLSGTKAEGPTGREAADHFLDRRETEGGDHREENEVEVFGSHLY